MIISSWEISKSTQNKLKGKIVKWQNLKINKCQKTWQMPMESKMLKKVNLMKSQEIVVFRSSKNHQKHTKVKSIPELKTG